VSKAHVKHLSELPVDIAASLGAAVAIVAKALVLALNNDGLNVVCNQEYAQAVPHVHYHLIPAPVLGSSEDLDGSTYRDNNSKAPASRQKMAKLEYEARNELDDDDGIELATIIRARL